MLIDDEIKKLALLIRDIPDFPKKGIIFKDITTLIADGPAFHKIIQALAEPYRDKKISKVIGIEARGFAFAAPVAYELGAGVVMVRKPGKLPFETISQSYTLEYGENTIEAHIDAAEPGENVLLVDDLLATGGTMEATASLFEKLNANIVSIAFIIELDFLKGRERLKDYDIFSLIHF